MMVRNSILNKSRFFRLKIVSIIFSFKVLFFFEFDSSSSDFFSNFKSFCYKNNIIFISLLSKLSNSFIFLKEFFFNSSIFLVYTEDLENLKVFSNFLVNNSFLSNLVGLSIDFSFINLSQLNIIGLTNVICTKRNNYFIILFLFFKSFFSIVFFVFFHKKLLNF